jgi:hypothetical protein
MSTPSSNTIPETLNLANARRAGKAALQNAMREPLIMVTCLVVLVELGPLLAITLLGILIYNHMNFLAGIYALAWLFGPFWGCLTFLFSFFCRSWFIHIAPQAVVQAEQRLEQSLVNGITSELTADLDTSSDDAPSSSSSDITDVAETGGSATDNTSSSAEVELTETIN